MTSQTEWAWYASDDAENYTVGPEPNRDAIVSAARDEELGFIEENGKPELRFWIVEARKADLRIADFCLPSDLFEHAEDEADSLDYGGVDQMEEVFTCSQEHQADLKARLRAACEEWQQAHGLSWRSWAFSETRNEETVTIDLTEDESGAE